MTNIIEGGDFYNEKFGPRPIPVNWIDPQTKDKPKMTDVRNRVALAIKTATESFRDPVEYYVKYEAGYRYEKETGNEAGESERDFESESWLLLADAVMPEITAAIIAERERCAAVAEAIAKQHEEDAETEENADYRERKLVYAKHVRRVARAILKQPDQTPA